MTRRPGFRSSTQWADLLFIAAGLLLSHIAYATFFPSNYALLSRGEVAGGFAASLITFWAVLAFWEPTGPHHTWATLFEQFCRATGLSLILHALLNYFQLLTRSFFLILAGAVFAFCLLAVGRRWLYTREESRAGGVVMIGFNPLANQVACSLGQPILGVIGQTAIDLPAGIPLLGEVQNFEEIIEDHDPTHIVIASPSFCPAPSELLKLRRRGIEVNDVPALYEKQFERVYCRGLHAIDMLLSPSLSADSRTLAMQAIYTNLVGLFFLIVLSPVLIAVSAAIFLFSGPGPAIEWIECAGFQKVPFRLLRFRTRSRDGNGEITGVGRFLTRLHLVNLPRLINVVRGEIALFGPRPVRHEFARRLAEIMPFYSIRFFVKPGALGDGPADWHGSHRHVSELIEIEHDLYYVKHASLELDLEILIRTLAGGRGPDAGAAELASSL